MLSVPSATPAGGDASVGAAASVAPVTAAAAAPKRSTTCAPMSTREMIIATLALVFCATTIALAAAFGGVQRKVNDQLSQEQATNQATTVSLISASMSLAQAQAATQLLQTNLTATRALLAGARPACANSTLAAGMSPRVPTMDRTAEIFDPLSAAELTAARDFMLAQPELNIVQADGVIEMTSNYLYSLDLHPPAKAAALAYIDGATSVRPPREARVTVIFGNATTHAREIIEFSVGPLPSPTAYARIVQPTIPWNMRPVDSAEYAHFEDVIGPAMDAMRNITLESFGTDYDTDGGVSCKVCTLTWTDTSPRGYTRGERSTWIWFLGHGDGTAAGSSGQNTEGFYMRATGIEMRIRHNSSDPSEWTITEVLYNGQNFASVDDLVTAYNTDPTFRKVTLPQDDDATWSSMRRKGAVRAGEALPPPAIEYPQGRRFTVDGQRVSWLGWTFHVGHSMKAGLVFRDIRFRGERIVYENALQEAYASYSGYAPVQAQSVYTDSGWGMGTSAYELVQGVDCPHGALYFDMQYMGSDQKLYRIPRSACIFEAPEMAPVMRHFDSDFAGGYTFISAYAQTKLVVRTSSSVYNYDYALDNVFYMDGTLENKAAASGYIQASFPSTWPSGDKEIGLFATRVRNGTAGFLHDHHFAYKVDVDILGTSNRVMRHDVKVKQFDLPWTFPSTGTWMRYMEHVNVSREEKGLSSYVQDLAQPSTFAVYSNGRNNRWGHPRAYKFQLQTNAIQLQNDSAPWMPAVQWSKYSTVFTARHDNISEDRLSQYAWFDMQAGSEPIVRFDDWAFDGDSLVDEDVVAWVVVGSMHMPHAEDVPVTYSIGTSASFMLKPMNYNDRSPVIDLTAGILVTPLEPASKTTYVAAGHECYVPAFNLDFYGSVDEVTA